jgi:hypothetical protein
MQLFRLEGQAAGQDSGFGHRGPWDVGHGVVHIIFIWLVVIFIYFP